MKVSASEFLNANILIVDDQAANVQLLERALDESGYLRVSSTMQPTEVGALHAKNDYDLILLDLKMPGMDGFQVMEALMNIRPADYLPVIVLTAEPAHKLRALQAGAKDFISKPFDLIEVKTRIRNMLEVRLLYKHLDDHNKILEQTVHDRTAELRASEARFRSLTALASDWYWEQNETGEFTTVSGPVFDMLGIRMSAFLSPQHQAANGDDTGWDDSERKQLQQKIAARQPFVDFPFSRTNAGGTKQHFRVSGEPMLDESDRFIGYRGIGVEYGETGESRAKPPPVSALGG